MFKIECSCHHHKVRVLLLIFQMLPYRTNEMFMAFAPMDSSIDALVDFEVVSGAT